MRERVDGMAQSAAYKLESDRVDLLLVDPVGRLLSGAEAQSSLIVEGCSTS